MRVRNFVPVKMQIRIRRGSLLLSVAGLVVAMLAWPRTGAAQCGGTCAGCCNVYLPNCTIPGVIVGSPSGQARPYTVTLRNSQHNPPSNVTALWLGYTSEFSCQNYSTPRPYTSHGGIKLDCTHPSCGIIDWPYNEISQSSGTGTFYAQFGGSKTQQLGLAVQVGLSCGPGYIDLECPEARSTDFDADGDTDQDDKVYIGQEIASGSPHRWCNLDTDDASNTVIDASDYMVIVNEMLRAALDTLCTCPDNPGDEDPDCAPGPTRAADNSPPDTTTLGIASTDGGCVTLRWKSPGDDYVSSQKLGVPKEFDLRYSSSTITSSNFNSATRYTATPTPGIVGATHTVTVDASALGARYWAIKTKDWAGNLSSMSAVLDANPPSATVSDLAVCATYKNCILVGWTSPNALNVEVRYATSAITNCSYSSANSAGTMSADPGHLQQLYISGLTQGHTYYFAVKSQDPNYNWSAISNDPSGTTPTYGSSCNYNLLCSGDGFRAKPAPSEPVADLRYDLSRPVPNPAGDRSLIGYSIPAGLMGETLDLAIFDVAGRRITTLAHGTAQPGRFEAQWDLRGEGGQRARPGMFFVRLRVGASQLNRTIVVGQ
jgi:hypothetical protein